MSENKNGISDYITYPLEFDKYTKFKPLFVIILTVIFFLIFTAVIFAIGGILFGEPFINSLTGNYESLNTINLGSLFSFVIIALILPSLFIANKIVGYRPFSSYASSREGWNWKLYFKCMLLSLGIYVIFTIISTLVNPNIKFNNQFTVLTFIAFLIIIPLQCIAEEFAFRGVLMQALGSWIKIPVAAIIIQAIIFGLCHSYSLTGVVTIIISGLLLGFIAWKSNGLETSSAIHSVNNLFSIMTAGFGLSQLSSNVSLVDSFSDIALSLVCVGLIYYIGNRYNWFSESS